jgi:hypothetical protein
MRVLGRCNAAFNGLVVTTISSSSGTDRSTTTSSDVASGANKFVESASVPRIAKSEALEIKMMAEFMAKGAKKRTKRRDFLAHGCPHPHADKHGLGSVISEKIGGRKMVITTRLEAEFRRQLRHQPNRTDERSVNN